jgi:hypothetical protein
MEGEREQALWLLTHADDAEAVEPPITEEFSTEKLGPGLRTLRYLQSPEEEGESLFGAVNYAFRSEEHETDLRIWAVSPDLGRLQHAIPDIDILVRATTIISRAELND